MRILLIDDDIKLCEALSYELCRNNFTVDICNDGTTGLAWIREKAHDLILLDRMLPYMSGLSILDKIRMEGINTPVILVTALGELNDKVIGLDCGADDYLVKPFEFDELMARIRCITRRPKEINFTSELSLGNLVFKYEENLLIQNDKSCSLSKKESSLLEIFLRNPKQILSRNILLARVWGPSAEVEDGNLDNYIYFLRRRLSSVNSIYTIKTIRGVGYKLEAKDV